MTSRRNPYSCFVMPEASFRLFSGLATNFLIFNSQFISVYLARFIAKNSHPALGLPIADHCLNESIEVKSHVCRHGDLVFQGDEGEPGVAGARGLRGPSGHIGSAGLSGLRGAPGVQGTSGRIVLPVPVQRKLSML